MKDAVQTILFALAVWFSSVASWAVADEAGQEAATVVLNPRATYQRIRGWSCNPYYQGISPRLRDQVLDDAIHELGLTCVRWQPPGGCRSDERRWEWLNDDGDPDHIHWEAFSIQDADRRIETWLVPFKKRVEANGDPFEVWLSPSFFDGGSTGTVPTWLLQSPGEYAENVISYLMHLKQKYGIEATHVVICNEAGNNNAFTPEVVIEMTKVLGARLKAAGFRTRGQFPDGVNAASSWRYIQAAKEDPEFWPYIDVLSYHWYGGNNPVFMPQIRDFARARGLDTAQTEFMNLTMDHLYEDLTLGAVSYWCIYGLGGPGPGGQNYRFSLANTSFTRGRQFWNFRQVMHYVRPGAVRIEATSDNPALRALAFVRNGRTTVILLNNKPPHLPRRVAIVGLPAGGYGVCQTVAGQPYQERGVHQAGREGSFVIDVPGNAVLTIYPRTARNLPPTVTDWRSQPEHLKQPSSTATLSAAAQDPELEPLSFTWRVVEHPPGSRPTLATPNASSTRVAGLTAEGLYVFEVAVSDGAHRVRREVMLRVFSGNQPPIPIDVHNRIPVMVTLPQNATLLRAGAFDLENDPITFRWRLARQPEGASALLETPNQPSCKLSNLTVPGDYVLVLDVSDPTHTVSVRHTVTVYPTNHAPTIQAVSATPDTLKASPAAAVALTAVTSDADGDTLTHWWRVQQAPPGAKVTFSRQGAARTNVKGLSVPGTYVFSLTVADRTAFSRREVRVTVEATPDGGSSRSRPHASVASLLGTR